MNENLLDKIETIFLVENMHIMTNGIVASVIRKMRFLEDTWGYKPLLLVGGYNIELLRMNVMMKFGGQKQDQNKFTENARILGVFDHFQKAYAPSVIETDYGLTLGEGETSTDAENGIYDIYKDGEHVRKEYYTGLFGRLRKVERLVDGKVHKRIFYDDAGCISKIQSVDLDNQDYYPTESYYTTDKTLCIKAEYDYGKDDTGETNLLRRLWLYDKNGNVVKECTSLAELAACCLDEICNDPQKIYLIVDEAGRYTAAPLAVTRKNVFRCCIVHNIFLINSYDLSSPPQAFYEHLCEHRNEFDGIVFLTMTERTDFIRKYPGYDPRKAFVIPHPYPYPIRYTSFEKRDHKKAIMIARFDRTKQIPHAISIFREVVNKVPDAILEIYGFGMTEEEEKVDNRIKELNLENNVRKMGFTNYPVEKIRGASAFLMTSLVEGMPLTLIESICNGCPVFAYDINYGPADTVVDRMTGFLFPRGDGRAFADKLIEYFSDIELQRTMSENCYKDAERFGVPRFISRWYSFMESLYFRRREMILKEISEENIAATGGLNGGD